nr:hypothetical protein [Abalone asfa-like virus]
MTLFFILISTFFIPFYVYANLTDLLKNESLILFNNTPAQQIMIEDFSGDGNNTSVSPTLVPTPVPEPISEFGLDRILLLTFASVFTLSLLGLNIYLCYVVKRAKKRAQHILPISEDIEMASSCHNKMYLPRPNIDLGSQLNQ